MKIINLRKYYPELYKTDKEMQVSDEVALALHEAYLLDAAYRLRTYRHKAYYSLDFGDNIEMEAVLKVETPQEHFERKYTLEVLYSAMKMLPDVQARRIYEFYILRKSVREIAKSDRVTEASVRIVLKRAKRNLQKNLEELSMF